MTPDEQDIFFVLVVGGGPGSGEFVYDAAGNLRSSNVGQATTDPVQGISCPQGFATYNGHGAVINLLSTSKGAFFQYTDTGSAVQGSRILSVASASGTDPVTGTSYPAALLGTDPVFGGQTAVVGSTIDLSAPAFTQTAEVKANPGSGSANPNVYFSAPEQGVSGHLIMVMEGTSPDGTSPGQLVIASEPTGFTVPAPVTKALLEVQGSGSFRGTGGKVLLVQETAGAPAAPPSQFIAQTAADRVLGIEVTGDTNFRWRIDSNGLMNWSSGAAGPDVTLQRSAANTLQLTTADLDIATAGRGLKVAEGTNARMGTATLNGTTAVVVANTSVTANTRIFLAVQGTTAPVGIAYVSGRTAGTSFSLKSTSTSDTAVVVAWLLVEPG